jgi:hypothetical protein
MRETSRVLLLFIVKEQINIRIYILKSLFYRYTPQSNFEEFANVLVGNRNEKSVTTVGQTIFYADE